MFGMDLTALCETFDYWQGRVRAAVYTEGDYTHFVLPDGTRVEARKTQHNGNHVFVSRWQGTFHVEELVFEHDQTWLDRCKAVLQESLDNPETVEIPVYTREFTFNWQEAQGDS